MKKRIPALMLCFAMCLSLMSVGVLAAPGNYEGFDGGTGTAANPYQIANLDQFNNLVNIINSGKPCSDTYFGQHRAENI